MHYTLIRMMLDIQIQVLTKLLIFRLGESQSSSHPDHDLNKRVVFDFEFVRSF